MGRHGITQQEFIERANVIHNNTYDYSNTHYTTMLNKINVTCPRHGTFTVQANNHVKQMKNSKWKPCGCPTCGREKVIQRNIQGRKTFEEFITEANEVHNFRYTYEQPYVAANRKVHVMCSVHGSFYPNGFNHLRGTGCPRCKNSRGETKIAKNLTKRGIKYTQQHEFNECVGNSGYKLKYDFWLQDLNTLIEYDGEQHFKPIRFHQNMTQEQADNMLAQTKNRDTIKNEYAIEKGIRLLRIPYTSMNHIEEILNELLN